MMMKHEEEKVMIAEHNSRTHQNYGFYIYKEV